MSPFPPNPVLGACGEKTRRHRQRRCDLTHTVVNAERYPAASSQMPRAPPLHHGKGGARGVGTPTTQARVRMRLISRKPTHRFAALAVRQPRLPAALVLGALCYAPGDLLGRMLGRLRLAPHAACAMRPAPPLVRTPVTPQTEMRMKETREARRRPSTLHTMGLSDT